ncbi:hypothetical protein Tco_1119758 [Tanacetum coccineum]
MYIEELKEGDEDGVESVQFRWWDRVDQWNTVKKDMHEHMEDEPDDALEELGKIWQREIQVSLNLFYLTHQIAAGEAKDNDVVAALNGNRELTLFNGMTNA